MQVKVCGKKLHTKIDIRNEMPDLICGRITAGEKYILTHDNKMDYVTVYVYNKDSSNETDDWERKLKCKHCLKDSKEMIG